MISPRIRVEPSSAELIEGFGRIRRAMHLPEEFPQKVIKEASVASEKDPSAGPGRAPRLDIEFVTIDPPGSMDLDQAYFGAKVEGGFHVSYAIADLGYFVQPDGPLALEAMARGKTLYSPDLRTPLYPTSISEGAASLLPDQVRPAILWSFDLNGRGEVERFNVERSVVKSGRQMTYAEVQKEIDGGSASDSLKVLRKVGKLRQRLEEERGGVNLRLPDQEVHPSAQGFELVYRSELEVERWNSQISLMTGMAAAKLMLEAQVGLVRTLPAPQPETIEMLRRSAEALGLNWQLDITYQQFIRTLDSQAPAQAAFLVLTRSLFQGVKYTYFNGPAPDNVAHHAIAAPYAHVTAPLRRMADRLTNELAILLSAKQEPPQWLLESLAEAPDIMKVADHRDRELDSRIVDFVEANALSHLVGEVFEGVIVQSGKEGGMVQLRDPAVLGPCEGAGLPLGHRIQVRLTEANPATSRIRFTPTTV
ncbi:MAG: RNB domain-containing ribonuclease [Actinomycetota bacterium]